MSAVIGFDPSLTSSGYCKRDGASGLVTGIIKPKKLGDSERIHYILNKFKDIVGGQTDLLVYEDYAMGARGRTFSIGELGGVLKHYCYLNNIPILLVPPASMKIFIAGNGQADKDQIMQHLAEYYNYIFTKSDEADACGLMLMGEYFLKNKRIRGTSKEARGVKGCRIVIPFAY